MVGTGGGPAFRDVLRDRLFPRVESAYHVDPERRAYLGHSFRGLFGAWVLQTDPDLFESYILLSPSLWWNGGDLLGAGFEDALAAPAAVFVAFGGGEDFIMTRTAERVQAALEAAGRPQAFHLYESADHQSLLPQAIWDGLVAAFGR